VPVRITRSASVVVLSRPAQRDTLLSAEHLTTIKRDITRLNAGYFSQVEQLIGHRLRRSVAAGSVLTPALVHQPPLIERGDRITLVSGGGGIAVRAPGEALSDASKGERLRARNLSSGKVVEGVVLGHGQIEVIGR